jgi:hypothetical protein
MMLAHARTRMANSLQMFRQSAIEGDSRLVPSGTVPDHRSQNLTTCHINCRTIAPYQITPKTAVTCLPSVRHDAVHAVSHGKLAHCIDGQLDNQVNKACMKHHFALEQLALSNAQVKTKERTIMRCLQCQMPPMHAFKHMALSRQLLDLHVPYQL